MIQPVLEGWEQSIQDWDLDESNDDYGFPDDMDERPHSFDHDARTHTHM